MRKLVRHAAAVFLISIAVQPWCAQAQQTDQPSDPRRPANLWEPVGDDHGAHGDFDAEAKTRSYQWWLTSHRGPVAGALGALGLGVAAVVARRTGP